MRQILIALVVLSLFPMTARAQTDKHVALGVAIGFREFIDDHFSKKNPSISVLYRLSRNPNERKQGWVWRLGGTAGYTNTEFDTDTDFDTDLSGTKTKIGSLRTIPIVVGVERAYRHERIKVGLSLLAGPSFNKFSIDGAARTKYESEVGIPLEDIEVKNSLAVRSGVGVWYDLSRWIGLHAGAYYLYGRPKATITAGGVSSSETWKIDRVSLSTGFAIGIF